MDQRAVLRWVLEGTATFQSWPAGSLPAVGNAIDADAFKAVCHTAARLTGGRMDGLVDRYGVCSYRAAVISYDGDRVPRDRVTVVCHTQLRLMALAEPSILGGMRLSFVDRPKLAGVLAGVALCEVVAAEELRAPLTGPHLARMSHFVRREVEFWQPGTVGEVLFNHWDC